MCDNPKTNPWVAVSNPVIRQLDKFVRFLKRTDMRRKGISESGISHIEFDVERIKKLPEEELNNLFKNKLIKRLITDIQKLQVERPIPDWCYAFF